LNNFSLLASEYSDCQSNIWCNTVNAIQINQTRNQQSFNKLSSNTSDGNQNTEPQGDPTFDIVPLFGLLRSHSYWQRTCIGPHNLITDTELSDTRLWISIEAYQ